MGRADKFNDKEKWCPKCKKWLVLDGFYEDTSRKSGRRLYCKHCERLKKAEYGTNTRDRLMSPEEIIALWESQNHKCAICKNDIEYLSGHLDHDHKTDEVRGLLCKWCNLGLGWFRDNPEFLKAAIEYLEKCTGRLAAKSSPLQDDYRWFESSPDYQD